MKYISSLSLVLFLVGICFGQFPGAERPTESSVTADDLATLGMKVSVTIIFDTSGSMKDRNKLAMAKQAFNWWLESAPKQSIVRWSLWSFDAERHDGVLVVDRKADAVEEVKTSIDRFSANGGTYLAKTITKVTRLIDAENKIAEEGKTDILRQIVLVFTDGKDSDLPVQPMQEKIQQLRNVGAEVFSIGYQGEGDYLAKVSDKFIMVDDEAQLKSGLSEFTYFIEKSAPQK